MSGGTYAPAACPKCRGPLAYGHATPTRMYSGSLASIPSGSDCIEAVSLITYDSRLTTPELVPISTSFRGDPNREYIADIVPSIPSRAHLAAFTVTPGDGHRADVIAMQLRNSQQFDVEGCHTRSRDDPSAVTVQPRPAEQIPGDLSAKEFEPALRIVHPGDEQEAHQPVEHPTHQMAIRRLTEPPRSHPFPRPDRDVASPSQRGA